MITEAGTQKGNAKVSERMLTEILAAHADHLVRGEAKEAQYLTLFPDYREELAPLLELAQQVRETLAPRGAGLASVHPSEAFRRRLRQELLTTARQRVAVPLPTDRSRWRQPWVIGAAARGSVISLASAVGVIAYLRRAKATKPVPAAGCAHLSIDLGRGGLARKGRCLAHHMNGQRGPLWEQCLLSGGPFCISTGVWRISECPASTA